MRFIKGLNKPIQGNYKVIKRRENRTMTNTEYRKMLIDGILEYQTKEQFTREELEKKPIRTLERIYDNVE